MNKWCLFLLAFVVYACSNRTMMTHESFSSVETGQSIDKVTAKVGEPYAIHKTSSGAEEYEYIERVASGNRLIYENHYILIVKNGIVVGKKTSQERTPAFDLIYQDDPNHHQYP